MMKSNTITPEQAISVLGTEIDVESEEAFALRMEIYENDYSLLSSIHFINLERTQPEQILQIIALFLSNADSLGAQHVYIDDKKRLQFCKKNYSSVIEALFDLLCSPGIFSKSSMRAAAIFICVIAVRKFPAEVSITTIKAACGAIKTMSAMVKSPFT